MRRVDWLPRMASPTSGASRSRFLTMRGVNCSWTKFQICPDSAPGALTKYRASPAVWSRKPAPEILASTWAEVS